MIQPVKHIKSQDNSRDAVQLVKGKVPPQAGDLEEAILGAVLVDKVAFDELMTVFSDPEVFYFDANKWVFEAVKSLSTESQPIDVLTVSKRLREMGKLAAVGGDYRLITLTQRVASAAHIEYHARLVLQAYMKRRIIAMASLVIERAYDDDSDVFELMDSFDAETVAFNDIVSKGRTDLTYADALDKVIDRVKMLSDADVSSITGTHTGFEKLDRHFGGWQPTDFIVIGARPGMGKTAFAIGVTVGAAKSGSPVGFISLEMSTEQLATRTVAVASAYHLNQLTRTGFEKQEYFRGLMRVVNDLRKLPIYIDDRPALTISEIRRKGRLMKRKHGIKVLIVDYIQLADDDTTQDIRQKVGKISRGLKAMAKELDITVIGLAQLSREVEKTAYKRPALHHLKESGDIEQDADAVCFLFRPAYYGLEEDTEVLDPDCNTEFIVAKYRHGGVGTIGLYFDENKTKYMDSKPGIDDLSAVRTASASEAFEGPVNVEEDNFPF